MWSHVIGGHKTQGLVLLYITFVLYGCFVWNSLVIQHLFHIFMGRAVASFDFVGGGQGPKQFGIFRNGEAKSENWNLLQKIGHVLENEQIFWIFSQKDRKTYPDPHHNPVRYYLCIFSWDKMAFFQISGLAFLYRNLFLSFTFKRNIRHAVILLTGRFVWDMCVS